MPLDCGACGLDHVCVDDRADPCPGFDGNPYGGKYCKCVPRTCEAGSDKTNLGQCGDLPDGCGGRIYCGYKPTKPSGDPSDLFSRTGCEPPSCTFEYYDMDPWAPGEQEREGWAMDARRPDDPADGMGRVGNASLMPLCGDQDSAGELGYANNSAYREDILDCSAAVGLMLSYGVGCSVNLTVPCEALTNKLEELQCSSLMATLGCGYTMAGVSLADWWCARMCCLTHGPPAWFGQPGLAACVDLDGYKVDFDTYEEYFEPTVYHYQSDSVDPDTNFPLSMRCERRWRSNAFRNSVDARCAYPDAFPEGTFDGFATRGEHPSTHTAPGRYGPAGWGDTVPHPETYEVFIGHGVTVERNQSVTLGEEYICEWFPTGMLWRAGTAGQDPATTGGVVDVATGGRRPAALAPATRLREGIGSRDDPYRIMDDSSGGTCTWKPGAFQGDRRITSVLRAEAQPGTDLQIGPILVR